VLDAAAAPGGKSFALAAWEPSVAPVMADLDLGRLGIVAANLRRLRRRHPLLAADAARPPFAAAFDRVVVDLPCSGTGTLRKHPEIKWRISEEEVGRLAGQGAALLAGAAGAVAPGGLLVAITCSLEAEENDDVAAGFLHDHRDFAPLDLAAALPAPLDAAVAGPGLWRLLPAGDHDGFTVSVLRRR
jgi:16S rRNA (cytosine967-C5)-methyltransferase